MHANDIDPGPDRTRAGGRLHGEGRGGRGLEASWCSAPEPRGTWLPREGARLAAFSWIKARFPFIGPCLGAGSIVPLEASFCRLDGVLAWGDRLPARLARRYAEERSLPVWTLEDGFLRSAGLGKDGAASVSLIADDLGVHFSPERPSRLERLLGAGMAGADIARAGRLREWIVRERLTKYNHLPDRPLRLPATRQRRILLVDQVLGDRSAGDRRSAAAAFSRMWAEAHSQPAAQILVKSHPDVLAGRARGHLRAQAWSGPAHWIDDPVSPHAVLDSVDEVWTVSSQLGLDALLRGIPVVTFGVPAYAGWGLTDDRAEGEGTADALQRRTRRLSIDEFAAAALIRYPLYFDPVRRRRTSPEGAIERLLSWRARALERKGHYLAVGFSRHKRKVVRRYVEGPWSSVRFASPRVSVRRLKAADHVLLWGAARLPPGLDHDRIIRVEDGFIRSVGLGAALIPPASLCFDSSGLYCDARLPSDLETLLGTAAFDAALLRRAARLRQLVVGLGITKYNLQGMRQPDYRACAAGRPVVVVAGQVPGDASLAFGLALHPSNLALLAAVRRERPDAFLIYKDHPDLVSGLRPGAVATSRLCEHADLVVGDVPVSGLLDAADEVHVATSQLGFEALLRGRRTVCHGAPFYAGWGLTDDRVAIPRRRRRLSLDALVAGTLILYPRYMSAETGLPCEAEDVVEEIARAMAEARAGAAARSPVVERPA